MATGSKVSPEANGVATLSEWKGRRFAVATLPTGLKVRLRTVTLDELAADEALPDTLVRVATLEMLPGGTVGEMARLSLEGAKGAQKSRELSRDMMALRDRLVLRSVVEPELAEADLAEIDPFDKDMIANLASRQLDLDSEGRRVWGVEPLNTFLVFREEHGCPPSPECEACERTIGQFSQVQ